MLEIEVASSRIISLFFILIFAKIIPKNICRSVPFYYHKIPFCKRIHFSRKKKEENFSFLSWSTDKTSFSFIRHLLHVEEYYFKFIPCVSKLHTIFYYLFLPFLWLTKWAHFFLYPTARPKKILCGFVQNKKSCWYCESHKLYN